MSKWVKMWKSYNSGPGEPVYFEFEKNEDIKNLIEYWEEEEYWDEGYYDILWEQIDKPPKEWLEKEIKEYAKKSKNLYKNYRRAKIAIEDTIKNYKLLL
ncbi:MAG: hypothetical protein WC503_00775 [Candidatus Shapirobacteria bacterium]